MSTNNTNGLKVLMEYIGTFILVGSLNLSTGYNEDGSTNFNWLLFLCGVFSAINIARSISGAHLNPAFTIAYYFEKPAEVRSKEQPLLTLYVLAQVLGGLSACFFSYIFYRENVFQLAVPENTLPAHALLAEVFATFLFIYVIFCQGDSNAKLVSESSFSSFVMAFSLLGAANIAGNISGGCLNPAVGFAQNFVRLIVTGNVNECKSLWIYLVGPSLGGVLAAYVYGNFFKTFFYHKNKVMTHSI